MIIDNFILTTKQLKKLKDFIIDKSISFNETPKKINRTQYMISLSYSFDSVDIIKNWKNNNIVKTQTINIFDSCPFIFLFLLVFILTLFILTLKLFIK